MSYPPLRYVRPHPGAKPPRWRWLARRRWRRAMRERSAAKAWNFMYLYGSPWQIGDAPPNTPNEPAWKPEGRVYS